MLASLSEETQLVLAIIGIAILFGIVLWNTKRNRKKLYHREQRNFKKNYAKKKHQRL
ncbi:hypothetical protein HN014_13810 [Aquimarina sp. TRL1]|uniref:hypothetical protein n=1 Tax=Aquimarina TaxID=290174 RepID=UPI00158ACFFB|nr:hypothetical protein [Aquimarina sp. TRL1]QKX05936.1 hypothetical protein HN014_13810 [Aquimarina sp. TRL1]